MNFYLLTAPVYNILSCELFIEFNPLYVLDGLNLFLSYFSLLLASILYINSLLKFIFDNNGSKRMSGFTARGGLATFSRFWVSKLNKFWEMVDFDFEVAAMAALPAFLYWRSKFIREGKSWFEVICSQFAAFCIFVFNSIKIN